MLTRRSFVGHMGLFTAAGAVLCETALAQQAKAAVSDSHSIAWLDSNENPAGPPASAVQAIVRGAADVGRYHFDEHGAFLEQIGKIEGVGAGQVLCGVGSSDVIMSAIFAFTSASRPMITGAPSYDIVVNLTRKLGRPVIEVPLTMEWAYPVKALAAEAAKAGGGLIYLCNPNNPTASLTAAADIEWLANHLPADTVLFVDEAYLEFADPARIESAIRHVRDGRSVVISRTFSKIYGMAGARAGYGCARADLIGVMNEYMDNIIPVLGLRAASAALEERATLVPKRRADNARIRGELCEWLRAQGVSYIDSHANFVMIDVGRDVKAFGEAMRAKGVAIGRKFPPLETMARVTMGTEAEMARFRAAFSAVRRA
jgi:histidinol-phosphate aminotransferase